MNTKSINHSTIWRLPACSLGLNTCVGLALASAVCTTSPPVQAQLPGPQKWVLDVGNKFQASDVQTAGGTLEFYWAKPGIAVAVSTDPNFGNKVLGKNVSLAIPDMTAQPPPPLSIPETAGAPASFDAYDSNYQWYWQAIGATRPNPAGPPDWQLGDYEGSGVKIADIDTGAPAVWDSSGTITGLHPEFNEYDPTQPELGGIVLLRDSNGNILNLDDAGHGTAVVSTLAAQHRGDGAMRGLAPKATIYCYKIDWNNFYSSLIEGWYSAAEFGCQIINNSLYAQDLPVERYNDINYKFPILIRKAAAELDRRGVLIVAAAGNFAIQHPQDLATYWPWASWGLTHGLHSSLYEPQDMPKVIVAGGTGPADYDPFASDLSVYNPVPGGQKGKAFNLDRVVNSFVTPPDWGGPFWWGSDFGSFLTVVAPMGMNVKDWSVPGRIIHSQMMYLATPWEDVPGEGLHEYWAGTSFASPITCGVAALAAEAYFRTHGVMPSPTTLSSIIKASADDLVGPGTDDFWVWNSKTLQFEYQTNVPADKPGKDIRYGYGRVNVVKAIEMARH